MPWTERQAVRLAKKRDKNTHKLLACDTRNIVRQTLARQRHLTLEVQLLLAADTNQLVLSNLLRTRRVKHDVLTRVINNTHNIKGLYADIIRRQVLTLEQQKLLLHNVGERAMPALAGCRKTHLEMLEHLGTVAGESVFDYNGLTLKQLIANPRSTHEVLLGIKFSTLKQLGFDGTSVINAAAKDIDPDAIKCFDDFEGALGELVEMLELVNR